MWNYSIAFCFVWVWNLVSHIEGREHRLRDFKNSLLRMVFVLKEEEVTGGWRKLHNEQLHDLCWSSNIIGVFRLRRIGRVWLVLGRGDWHGGFWGKKGPHWGWEDNIEIDFIGQGGDGVDWNNLTGDRDKWKTVWNTATKLGFCTGQGISWLVEDSYGGFVDNIWV
jgi:hypothetical protein